MIHIKQNGYKLFGLLLIISLITTHINAQSCEDMLKMNRADSLFQLKEYNLAKNQYLEMLKLKHTKRVTYYYLAVCYGNLNLLDSACHYLEIAAKKGLKYQQVEYFETDTNLDPLRKTTHWTAIKKVIIENTLRTYSIDTILLNELKRRKELDQKYRALFVKMKDQQQLDSMSLLQKAIDLDNQKWLKKTILKIRWPTINKVGQEGEHSAWLLVQHADNNVALQKRCLKKMYAAEEGTIDLKNLAYLHDRVLVNEGKEQVYGTQFQKVEKEGKFVLEPKPIKDASCVNLRRSYMKLPTIEYYLENASKRYIDTD